MAVAVVWASAFTFRGGSGDTGGVRIATAPVDVGEGSALMSGSSPLQATSSNKAAEMAAVSVFRSTSLGSSTTRVVQRECSVLTSPGQTSAWPNGEMDALRNVSPRHVVVETAKSEVHMDPGCRWTTILAGSSRSMRAELYP